MLKPTDPGNDPQNERPIGELVSELVDEGKAYAKAGRVKTEPRMARPTVFSDALTGSETARAASMIAPYCTPDGHAVWHARQSRHA